MSSFARILIVIGIVAWIAAGPIGGVNARSTQPQTGELLVNPGFEDPFVQEGSADIFVANGWQAWYVTPDGVNYPSECKASDSTCKPYRIPVYRPSQPQNTRIPPRAASGNSQQWGISYAVYIAGVYQVVGNLTPGTRLRFSALTQGFNCDNDNGCFGSAGRYGYSYEAGDMQTRVGIDPTGGTNAFASTVVWSSFANPLDAFVLQSVEAVAQSATATVFIWSSPTYPEKHTDIYVDNASLVAVGQGPAPTTAPAQAAQPTQPAGTPGPTPTIPAGATTYTVVAGDTLFAIAQRFNLTLDQLLALNPGLTSGSIIQVGQVINVAGQAPTPVATQAPTNTPAPSPTLQPSPTVAPTGTSTPAVTTTVTTTVNTPAPTLVAANSGLCMQAFEDSNANAVRDSGEALAAGVKFDIQSEAGQTTSYTTDGKQEPHCISNLPDGRYAAKVTLPAGEAATTDTQWSLSLLSGTNINLAVGVQQAAAPTAEPTSAPASTPVAAESVTRTPNNTASLTLLVGGVFIILAAVALFFGLRSRHKAA